MICYRIKSVFPIVESQFFLSLNYASLIASRSFLNSLRSRKTRVSTFNLPGMIITLRRVLRLYVIFVLLFICVDVLIYKTCYYDVWFICKTTLGKSMGNYEQEHNLKLLNSLC